MEVQKERCVNQPGQKDQINCRAQYPKRLKPPARDLQCWNVVDRMNAKSVGNSLICRPILATFHMLQVVRLDKVQWTLQALLAARASATLIAK